MRGNITRRGKSSWRIKFDVEPDANGTRQYRLHNRPWNTQGRRAGNLPRLLRERDQGTLVDASKVTVEAYLWSWLEGKHGLSPVTQERYREVIARGIAPGLGSHELQKLKPVHIRDWLSTMIRHGSRKGGPLTARTVRHSYRVLNAALKEAVRLDMLARNVAEAVPPPKMADTEVEILDADQIAAVLDALKGHTLHPIASLALATGMRRGELLALRWQDVSLEGASLNVARSLEQPKGHLRFKPPKTKHGRRTIKLPPSAVSMLREHRKAQIELRLQLGMGKHKPNSLVFCNHEGNPISPNYLSIMWGRVLPKS